MDSIEHNAAHMLKTEKYEGQQPLVLSDCRTKLSKDNTLEKYPEEFRMITARVIQDGKADILTFMTNNFDWSAYSICALYLARWGIEGQLQRLTLSRHFLSVDG